jgi:hypothetical protein
MRQRQDVIGQENIDRCNNTHLAFLLQSRITVAILNLNIQPMILRHISIGQTINYVIHDERDNENKEHWVSMV